ncbi:unnamed protein product, partial [Phaeothamnion confervicola]
MARVQGSPLARELCAVYSLIIVYATLHPFSGWRDRGISPWAWAETWPRQVLPFDLALNTAAYMPLGAFIVWAAWPRLMPAVAVLLAPACGALLSAALESLQTYLPSRIPSLADFATNTLGAALGALAAALVVSVFGRGFAARAFREWF